MTMLLVAVIIAVGFFCPRVVAVTWGVPWRVVPAPERLRSGVVGVILTGLVAALTRWPLAEVVGDGLAADGGAAATGATLALTLAFLGARRRRRTRALDALGRRLGSPTGASDAARRIAAIVRGAPAREAGLLAILAAGPLTRHRRAPLALELLDATIDARPSPLARAMACQVGAMAHLSEGHLEDAEAALAAAPPNTIALVDAALRATEALVAAIAGGSERALSLLDEVSSDRDEAARDRSGDVATLRAAARAHALHAMGREEDAEAALDALVGARGVAALDRVIRPVGAASDLAKAMVVARTLQTG